MNLGDQVWGQADPLGAYELQEGLGAVEMRGNNDEKPFLEPSRLQNAEELFAAWLASRVPRSALKRLAELPVRASVMDGKGLVAHGTPTSPWPTLFWKLEAGRPVHEEDAEVREGLGDARNEVDVEVVGHTHLERVVELDDRVLVNAGAVSWQLDGDPRARWTLINDRAAAGGWNTGA